MALTNKVNLKEGETFMYEDEEDDFFLDCVRWNNRTI